MIALAHNFPHTDLHLFSGFRDEVIKMLANHNVARSEVLSLSFGNLLYTWMSDNQIYKEVGNRIHYLLNPYFQKLSVENIFQNWRSGSFSIRNTKLANNFTNRRIFFEYRKEVFTWFTNAIYKEVTNDLCREG